MDFRFVFINVQAAGADFTTVESFDKGSFVDDGAASRVDDRDARFHFGEFGGGEDVTGLFLWWGRGVSYRRGGLKLVGGEKRSEGASVAWKFHFMKNKQEVQRLE